MATRVLWWMWLWFCYAFLMPCFGCRSWSLKHTLSKCLPKRVWNCKPEEMDSVHCNSLLLLLGSKFLIGFHSPSNIEADSVHCQLQTSQLFEIRVNKWLHPCNQILMHAFQAYHGCRRLLLWSWIHMQIWTSWYLFRRLPCPKWREMDHQVLGWLQCRAFCTLISASISSVEQFQMSVKLFLHSWSTDNDELSKEQLLQVRWALQDCPTICDIHDDGLFCGRSKTGTIVLQPMSDRHSAPSCGEMHTT